MEFVNFLLVFKLPRKNLKMQRRKRRKEVKVRKEKKPKKLKRMKRKRKVLEKNKQPRRKIEPHVPLTIPARILPESGQPHHQPTS